MSGIQGSYIFSCSVTIYSLILVAPDNLMFFYEKLFTFKKFFQIIYKCLSSNLIYESNTYFCHLLITLANSLNPDQDQQIVRPDLDPNCLNILIAFKKLIRFLECSWNHIFRFSCICGNFTCERIYTREDCATRPDAEYGIRNIHDFMNITKIKFIAFIYIVLSKI